MVVLGQDIDSKKGDAMDFKKMKIAIVGVSLDEEKYGYKIFKDLKKNGYNVFGVNPKLKTFEDGTPIYPSISSIQSPIDMVITVVPPRITEQVVDECIKLQIKHIWFQPGSESESAIEKARKNNIKTTTACFMVSNKIW